MCPWLARRFRPATFVTRLSLLSVLTVLAFAGCTQTQARREPSDSGSGGDSQRDSGAIPVVTAAAEVTTVPVTLNAVGTVEAISSVEIRAQVTGQLQDILFSPGQEVRKGQPLFTLDPRPLEAALRQAEAVMAKDQAQAHDAAVERQRYEDLFKRGLIPRAQYETQTANAAALEATVAADRAQVDQARLNLQYARITAPLDGRTGALLAHVGDLVRANDTEPLVTINQMSPIYVSFSVPARFLTDIRRYAGEGSLKVSVTGQSSGNAAAPARAAADNASHGFDETSEPAGPNAEGKLSFINNTVDPTTATITLKATFPNRNGDLWPGLFVQVALQLSLQPNAVVVPAIAVQTSQQGQYVYVLKPDRTVEMRSVTVDRQQGDQSIIASGLNGGEEVVTKGQLRLVPGARITTARPAEPTS